MSQRYETTPGYGLVARHGDSVLWVGPELDPEAWDALGAVLDVMPGTDPTGAETAASLTSLTEVLRKHPATTFAALMINDGHAQGVLRGPVTICNTTTVAPATGYEQFGITVPFEMSEAVYVGHAEMSGNHPAISQLLDLDAGVVPGGGAWVHPITSGHRYASSASGTHTTMDTGEPQRTVDDSAIVEPVRSAGAAGLSTGAAVDGAAAAGAAAVGAAAVGAAAVGAATADGASSAAERRADAQPDQQEAAHVAESRIAAAPEPPHAEQPRAEESPSAELPSLSAPPSPWAMPDVAAGSDAVGGGFTPAEDHLQIDLRAAAPASAAQPLPLIPTSGTSGAPAQAHSSVLVFDDGSTFALDHDYVIGRRPERHELVQSGQARPLTVVDPDTVLSGAHAALRLHGPDVYLEDLGSLNGSHVAPPGATDWTRVEPFTPVRLEPGTRLLFGWTVATYSGGRDRA